MYDPKKYKDKKLPRAGDRIDAVVTDIRSGKLSDFVTAEILSTWKCDPKANAIEVSAKLDDGYVRKRTIIVPSDDQVHPKSNIAKWKKTYGKYPEVDQKIFLVADDEGYYQFPL